MFCPECKKEIKRVKIHIEAIHKISCKEFYDKYFFKEHDGTCKYCNEIIMFNERYFCYPEFCSRSCTFKWKWNNDPQYTSSQKIIASNNMKKITEKLWKDEEFRKRASIRGSDQISLWNKRVWTDREPDLEEIRQNSVIRSRENIHKRNDRDKRTKLLNDYTVRLWKDKDPLLNEERERQLEIHSINGSNSIRKYYLPKIFYYNTIKMRSSWEVSFAEYLDKNNVIWEYEPETFKLCNGKRYIPDFFIPFLDIYIEIKPEYFLTKEVLEKLQLFKDLGKTLLVISDIRWEKSMDGISLV